MKIRNGFVSNSSSSSFVCDITGRSYTEYEASLEDADMYECENGHTFTRRFFIDAPVPEKESPETLAREALQKIIAEIDFEKALDIFRKNHTDHYRNLDKNLKSILYSNIKNGFENALIHFNEVTSFEEEDEDEYSLPARNCPICQMTETSRSNLITYLLKTVGKTRTEIMADIRSQYNKHTVFEEDMRVLRKTYTAE